MGSIIYNWSSSARSPFVVSDYNQEKGFIESHQSTVPYFDGAGSLIDPQSSISSCPFGCSTDLIKLHPHSQQNSAGFFQVFRIPGVCEAVKLEGLVYADVEVRSWSGAGSDSVY